MKNVLDSSSNASRSVLSNRAQKSFLKPAENLKRRKKLVSREADQLRVEQALFND